MSDSEVEESEAEGNNLENSPQAVRDRIKQQLAAAQEARKRTPDNPAPAVDRVAAENHRRALQRMREFLLSGEPILIEEVGQWLLKQSQAVRDELVEENDLVRRSLLEDLRAIALHLAQTKRSPWNIRYELEERYEKSLILDLSVEERRAWLRWLLSQSPEEEGSHDD